MPKRKPSVIDKVIRSSRTPGEIVKNALDNLPPYLLPKFIEVASTHHSFKGSLYLNLHKRRLVDYTSLLPLSVLKDIPKDKLFHFCLGLLKRYKNYLAEFVRKEAEYEKNLLLESFEQAKVILDEIEDKFGSSFWLENNKISLHALMKPEEEYELKNDYSQAPMVGVLLKNQAGLARNIDSEEDLSSDFVKSFQDVEESETTNILKYRVGGYHPKVKIDEYSVLASEVTSTLIDLYKAFEFLILRAKLSEGKKEVRTIGHDFLQSLGHRFSNSECDKVDDISGFRSELELVDFYTKSDYQSVFIRAYEQPSDDLGLMGIYAKSLAYLDVRLLPRTLSNVLINHLSNLYRKKDRYIESRAYLNNLCWAFRNSAIFWTVSNLVYCECDAEASIEDNNLNLIPVYFSNIPTPYKLFRMLGAEKSKKIYKRSFPTSSTFEQFTKIYNFGEEHEVPDVGNQRELKYLARKLIKYKRYEEAVYLYENSYLTNDCEVKKDYLNVLCKNGTTLKAAALFLKLVDEHENALEYFAIEGLHKNLMSNVNKIKSIEVPLALYKFRFIQNNSLNKNATAIALAHYIKSTGKSVPSDLDFQDSNKQVIEFLEHVCNRDLLVKSMLFRYQIDAYDERIKICNLLSSRKLSNVDKLVFESKELSKRKVLDSAAKHVSSSKVYADKDYVRTKTWDDFSESYEEFINIDSYDELYEQSLVKATEDFEKNKNIDNINQKLMELLSKQLTSYLQIGDKKAKAIFSMMKYVIEEYCFGLKGLNGYLSTRIRHGTLLTTLIGPSINEGVVSEDEITEDNELIGLVSGIERELLSKLLESQKKFNSDILSIIKALRDVTIQITANSKGIDANAFDFNINKTDVLKIQSHLNKSPTINECWAQIDLWLSERTADACSRVQKEIDTKVSDKIAKAIDGFVSNADAIILESEVYSSREFLSKLSQTRQSIFNQISIIRSWFNIDHSIVEQEYTFDVVTDIAETMLRTSYLDVDTTPKITVSHKVLSSLVDIIYNLLSNAIKHSNIDRKNLKVAIIAECQGDDILLSMINSTNYCGDLKEKNLELKNYTEDLSESNLQFLLQKEGGTGIAKISSILKHELSSAGFVELCFLSNVSFRSSIKLNKQSGISLHEITNS